MHLPVSSPKKGISCWFFAVVCPVACSVDFPEACVAGVVTLNANGLV